MQPRRTPAWLRRRAVAAARRGRSPAPRRRWSSSRATRRATLAGALAAAYARVPLAHVEAGLRSGAAEPFPEDLQPPPDRAGRRRFISRRPTAAATALVAEGIAPATIDRHRQPGDRRAAAREARLAADASLRARVAARCRRLRARPLVLVTAHRRENHARDDGDRRRARDAGARADARYRRLAPSPPGRRSGLSRGGCAASPGVTLVAAARLSRLSSRCFAGRGSC